MTTSPFILNLRELPQFFKSEPLDVNTECRPHFPGLEKGYLFADNAGGSQCLKEVVDKISDYLLNTNVQLGADYSISKIATRRVEMEAHTSTRTLINAESTEEVVYGSSTTQVLETLSRSMEDDFEEGEEIIVTSEHEANVGPWVRLAARRNLEVKFWTATRGPNSTHAFDVSHHISTLKPLLSSKTRLVAFTACSNILGGFVDVKEVVETIRHETKGNRKVEVCVDCVAYAPHRQIDIQDWDVDYAAFSFYKVYGPHTSVLYTRLATHTSNSLFSLAHYFKPADTNKNHKLTPGGPGYELTYGSSAVLTYLISLGIPTVPTGGGSLRAGIAAGVGPMQPASGPLKRAFERIADWEEELMKPLLEFLTGDWARDRGVKVVGSPIPDKKIRAPTISFVVAATSEDGSETKPKMLMSSKDIVGKVDAIGNIGIRYGHFYAHRLLTDLKLDPEDGVVRISLVHYNTKEEVNRIIEVLKDVLAD